MRLIKCFPYWNDTSETHKNVKLIPQIRLLMDAEPTTFWQFKYTDSDGEEVIGTVKKWFTQANDSTFDRFYFGVWSGLKETAPIVDYYMEFSRNGELTHDEVVLLAKLIWETYKDDWVSIAKALALHDLRPDLSEDVWAKDLPDNWKQKTTYTTGTITTTEDDPRVGTKTNQHVDTYGFNSDGGVHQNSSGSDTMPNREDDEDVNTVTVKGNTGRNYEIEHTGTYSKNSKRTKDLYQHVLEEIDLASNFNFYIYVFKDIDEIMTCQCYENFI